MFESCTKRERMGAAKMGLVVGLAAVIASAHAAVFVKMIGDPLATAMAGVRTLPAREPARDDLPDFGEEIAVTAPYRPKRAVSEARGAPWANPDPVTVTALSGYCVVDR